MKVEDEYVVVLNEDGLPQMRISPVYRRLLDKSASNPEWMKGAPYTTPVRRLDDVKAAKELDLAYMPPAA